MKELFHSMLTTEKVKCIFEMGFGALSSKLTKVAALMCCQPCRTVDEKTILGVYTEKLVKWECINDKVYYVVLTARDFLLPREHNNSVQFQISHIR